MKRRLKDRWLLAFNLLILVSAAYLFAVVFGYLPVADKGLLGRIVHGMTAPVFKATLILQGLSAIVALYFYWRMVAATKRCATLMFFLATGRMKPHPPLDAQFLFYLFLTPENCDALVGDLEERYRLIRRKFGRRKANFWYWFQTFISLRPIIWAALKRVSGLVALIEAYRRIRG
jgi:hypothetical protein